MMQPEDSAPAASTRQDGGGSREERKEAGGTAGERKEAGARNEATTGENKKPGAGAGAPAAADHVLVIANPSDEFLHIWLRDRTHPVTATVEGLADDYRVSGPLGQDACSLFVAKGRKATIRVPGTAGTFCVPFEIFVPTVRNCKRVFFRFERKESGKPRLEFAEEWEDLPKGVRLEETAATLTILPKEGK
jgi:hypothetical protein